MSDYKIAVGANRVLAVALRARGLNPNADRFADRAQSLQRRVLLCCFRIPQYVGSRRLDLISDDAYSPNRSFITYALVVLAFAAAYCFLGGVRPRILG